MLIIFPRRKPGDPPPQVKAAAVWGAILFAACLVLVLYAARRFG